MAEPGEKTAAAALAAFFRFHLALAVTGLLLVSLTPYMPAFSLQAIDLPSHFVPQYAIAAVILALFALVLRMRPRWLAILALVAALNVWQLWPFLPAPPAAAAGQPLVLLQANTLFLNKDPARLKALIAQEKPDLVVLSEINGDFIRMLSSLKADYPHQNLHPENGNPRGLGVISKLPLGGAKLAHFDAQRIPAQVFTIEHDGAKLQFVSVHPFTPLAGIDSRDETFSRIARDYRRMRDGNLVILGDFNATPWAPALKKLKTDLRLANSREGRGVMPTWPAGFPTALLRLPIDHVLVTANIAVLDHRLGPDIGSDHLPALVTLALKGAGS